MIRNRKDITLFFIGCLSALILVFIMVILNAMDNKISDIPKDEMEIVLNCSNKSLEETAKCVTAHVKTFYNYTKTLDEIELSFEELKSQGGDCNNYAKLYERIGEKIEGIHAKRIWFTTEENVTGHAVTVFSNKEGYCMLDNTLAWCGRFAK